MLATQREDLEYLQYAWTIGITSCHFDFDKDGLFVRHSPLDGAFQTTLPVSLRDRVISLYHSPLTLGHRGKAKKYLPLGGNVYWPFMAGDIAAHV